MTTEIAVVGAGPTGSTAAIAFARRGARVVLLEGHPRAAQRFAGEWIHPPGVAALQRLGVDTQQLATSVGHGMAIFGDDAQDPIRLPYPKGISIARVHSELVASLREQACALDGVTYLPDHVLTGLDGNTLRLEDRRGQRSVSVVADRIIGADGRSSKVRAALGIDTKSEPLSSMAGLELRDAQLPLEGMGHVFIGGPGPALLYRLDSDTVRACLDVPFTVSGALRKGLALYESFARVLPAQLLPAFRRAVDAPFTWASTRFCPRACYGKGSIWLAGDAVGHLHPLSGIGITLGLLDAAAAAHETSLAEYRRQRTAQVVELLSSVLYLAFARHDQSATRIRHGLLRLLRTDPRERRRTMRLLTGEDRSGVSFARAFMRATGRVVAGDVGRTMTRRQSVSELTQHLRQDATWLKWPLSACLPASEIRGLPAWSNTTGSVPLGPSAQATSQARGA